MDKQFSLKEIYIKIKTSHYKSILRSIVLCILALVVIYFLFTWDFRNPKNNDVSDILNVILISALVSLFINLVAAFLIIILIEERDRDKGAQQAEANQSVVIFKLTKSIKEFIKFVACIYKATSIRRISDLDLRSKDIFYETDVLVEHLNSLHLEGEGYIASQFSLEEFMKNPAAGFMADSWLESLILFSSKIVKDVVDIQNNFLVFIKDTEIAQLVDEIAKLNSIITNKHRLAAIRSIPSIRIIKQPHKCRLYPDGVSILQVYDLLRTLDLVYYLKLLMNRIDDITNTKNFEIPEHIFTESWDPLIGSGRIKE